MDYNVIKANSLDAFRFYKNDEQKYNKAMTNLYIEGEKNPSVAKVILDDTITKGVRVSIDISKSAVNEATVPKTLPLSEHFTQMAEFDARINIALQSLKRGMNATEIPDDKSLNSTPEKQSFDTKFNELYPKTAKTRERIIEAHRISMDNVTPKATWSEKVMYAKSDKELKELYPKSYPTRTMLYLKGQIRNNEVTKRVNGFFERLSYSPFVKNGLKFASEKAKKLI